MGLSMDKVGPIKEEFENKYWFSEPYFQYVVGCGISTLQLKKEFKGVDIALKDGESLDDLCIAVSFRKEPPKELEFPSEYRGVRVVYDKELRGEALPL